MARHVVGYHGTTLSAALDIEQANYKDSQNSSRWLGKGLYFFEDNLQLAVRWAEHQAMRSGQPAAIVKAEIDLSACLDLTNMHHQSIVRNAFSRLDAEWQSHPEDRPEQIGMSLDLAGRVNTGFKGDLKNYGRNRLDYAVIEKAILMAKQQFAMHFDSVRGLFIEEAPLYRNSWFYECAHIALAIRDPSKRVSNPKCICL